MNAELSRWWRYGVVCVALAGLGVLQLLNVTQHGYWHARSTGFSSQPLIVALEWAQMPGDVVFIVFGVVPLVFVTLLTYRHAQAGDGQSPPAAGGMTR